MKDRLSDVISIRGNKVRYNKKGDLFYASSDEPLDLNISRLDISKVLCPRCRKSADDHDACLGYLPGVYFACCGHGTSDSYIYFKNGVVIRGNFKASMEREWIKYKPKFEIEK